MLLDPETLARRARAWSGCSGRPASRRSSSPASSRRTRRSARPRPRRCAELSRLRQRRARRGRARRGSRRRDRHAIRSSRPEEQEIVQRAALPRRCSRSDRRPGASSSAGCTSTSGWRASTRCLETLEVVLPWLPAVLALSLNSPYLDGREDRRALEPRRPAARAAARRARRRSLARRAAGRARSTEAGGDYTRIWWDVRPHPAARDARGADARPADERSPLGRARRARAGARAPRRSLGDPLDRERVPRRRGRLRPPAARPVGELLALVEPAARELGTLGARRVAARAAGGARASSRSGERSGLVAVAADLVARTAE